MYRPFKFLLLILVIQRYRSVDCHAPGSLIWSRNRQKFIGASHVSRFGAYEQEIVAKSREEEKHNFQGEVLKLSYVEDYNMVNFIDNDTKVTGVCGDIWNTLAEYSNFTLVTIQTSELTDTGGKFDLSAINMIRLNETQIVPRLAFTSLYSDVMDFTMPIWETRYRIYIQPEWQTDTNWMFNMFERKVCCAIVFFFLLLSVLGYLMQNISIKVFGDENGRHNFDDHLFHTFGTLCSQGSIPDTLDRRSKIFSVSKKTFSWLLLIVLSSHVISHMTNVKVQPPFEDFESLLNKTDLFIMMYQKSIAADQYWLEDTMQAFGNRFCEMVAVGKSYFPIMVSAGVPKGFKYKRTFDIGILKMKESGLINRAKKRWLKSVAETTQSGNLGLAKLTPVNLNQVLMLFIILCTGIVASVIIFVLEVIVSIYKSNQR